MVFAKDTGAYRRVELPPKCCQVGNLGAGLRNYFKFPHQELSLSQLGRRKTPTAPISMAFGNKEISSSQLNTVTV